MDFPVEAKSSAQRAIAASSYWTVSEDAGNHERSMLAYLQSTNSRELRSHRQVGKQPHLIERASEVAAQLRPDRLDIFTAFQATDQPVEVENVETHELPAFSQKLLFFGSVVEITGAVSSTSANVHPMRLLTMRLSSGIPKSAALSGIFCSCRNVRTKRTKRTKSWGPVQMRWSLSP
jgi:hypothetical protein